MLIRPLEILTRDTDSRVNQSKLEIIGPLHDPVTWYGINYTGTQITQWDFQNKGKSGWTGASSFVLEVPLRNLRSSVIYSAPRDRIVQRAYYMSPAQKRGKNYVTESRLVLV